MASSRQGSLRIIAIARQLSEKVDRLSFAFPVTHVYNPLDYAWSGHCQYLERYGCSSHLEAILLGMNPGPFGMAQTGVPFGEVEAVRDWMGLEVKVQAPAGQHPKRPVLGVDCARSEVSGRRLWGWARSEFGSPEAFFRRFFVANYCPLMFLEASGRNRTPDRLPAEELSPLLAACDEALRRTVEAMRPGLVIGVGRFAESRARSALQGLETQVGGILHPSPASPAANRDWRGTMTRQLEQLGIAV